MPKLFFDISMSLDGFVAGPNQTLEQPLGERGEELHDWIVRLASWREAHGMEGGETGPDDIVAKQLIGRAGAVVMGRRMFSNGAGPWEDDPKADGWWGDEPPFRAPVFILTHHDREPVEKAGGTTYTFVTDGIESALEQARAAAGDKDIQLAGGASVIQQYLNVGLVDEFQVHVVPIFLGGGVRLFNDLDAQQKLERTSLVDSPAVTHLAYRVVKA
jgi:dihydrofolate reductase